MPEKNRQRVYVAACGAVSPWGDGLAAIGSGLREGRSAMVRRTFPGAGNLSVGACGFVDNVPGEDRSVTLLMRAMMQLHEVLGVLHQHVVPERRGVCVGTSKPALMLYIEDPDSGVDCFNELLPDYPARCVAKRTQAAGPLQSLSAACATALHNIIRGAEWIAYGNADYVIAGATDAALTDLYLTSLVQLGAMTRQECKPFDVHHNGFTAGEGAGLVVLVNEEALVRCKLTPLAEISGWALGSDAFHATACDTSGSGTASVLQRALLDAGTRVEELDLLSVHATGTPLSDLADANALRLVYGDAAQPPILSVKGAIGHLMGACGVIEFAAALECMREQMIPRVTRFSAPAPGCERLAIFNESARGKVDRVLKWNTGFGGQIAACIIERHLAG